MYNSLLPLLPPSHPLPTSSPHTPFHHAEKPERSSTQAVRDFVSEVLSILIDPLSDAITSNPFEDEDDPDSLSPVDSSLFRELSRSSWGQALVQGGQFKALLQEIEKGVERQATLSPTGIVQQRVVKEA